IALILLFSIIFIFMYSLNWITQHGVSRTVPSVTGKSLQAITPMLEEKGFEVVVQDSVYYDSLPPSVIVKQVPEADAVVKVNRTVYVTINRVVPPDVEMPNLLGFSFRNAEMVLNNMGLKLGDTTFKPDFAKNSVLGQSFQGNAISPGTKIKIGSRISLVLGSGVGNEDMPVPELVGLTYEEAKILMEAQGLILVPVVIDPLVRDTASAYVYKQNPEPKNEENRRYRIRPGQMMDIWLGLEKPVIDSSDKEKQKPVQQSQEN
ncbi:MAG TPA: PASTA domain-containing protein, partial [Chitinophagaceae bacterium]|nr:PASTA domain-containing protein [Chitinophagaceae bacterium]